jgi:hypothetical protein
MASAPLPSRPASAQAFGVRGVAEGSRVRASFSSMAFVTKSVTDVPTVTQCGFSSRSRCSGFGMRVASCTDTTSSLRYICRR